MTDALPGRDLTQDEYRELLNLVARLDFSDDARRALLHRVPREVVRAIPEARELDLRLGNDLNTLHENPEVVGLKQRPVAIWLENATRLAHRRRRPEALRLAELCLITGGKPDGLLQPESEQPPPTTGNSASLGCTLAVGMAVIMLAVGLWFWRSPEPQPVALGRPVASATAHRPALMPIPAGEFTMGSPAEEQGRDNDETQHTVTLTRPILMMRTEVTQAQWTAVMGANPSYFKNCPDCPVERVSWFDAVAYANALSHREGRSACYALTNCAGAPGTGCAGRQVGCDGNYQCAVEPRRMCTGYRLPTEAEWEYAARAGDRSVRYGPVASVAWYDGNSDERSHPVSEKPANAWGLRDMLGNAWEWCWDRYERGLDDARDPQGAASGDKRTFRGGSWVDKARTTRAADRGYGGPMRQGHNLGFRLVRAHIKQ